MPRLVAVGLLAATLAADGPSQAPEVRTSLGLAQRMKEEDPEHAAWLLRRAWLLCEGLEDRERRTLQDTVADQLRDLDRNGIRVVRAQSRMIENLRDFAAIYSGAGWFQTAEHLLLAAEALLPEAVADDLRILKQRRIELEQALAGMEVPGGSNDQLLDWFRNPYNPEDQDWKVTRSGVFSPRLREVKTQTLFSERAFDGDGRIRVDLRFGKGAKAALAWCFQENRGTHEYFILEVLDKDASLGVRLYQVKADAARGLRQKEITQTRERILGWHSLEVVATGPVVTLFVDGHAEPLHALLDRENRGRIGFFVSGDSEFRDPVHFRNLSVERFTTAR